MCQLVYLAADKPLRLIPWDEGSPAFHVREVASGGEGVGTVLSKKHIYYVGGSEKCGCSFGDAEFDLDLAREYEGEEELALKRKDLASLQAYLLDAVKVHGKLELFATDADHFGEPPRWRGSISPEEMTGDEFHFAERELLIVQSRKGKRESQEAGHEE